MSLTVPIPKSFSGFEEAIEGARKIRKLYPISPGFIHHTRGVYPNGSYKDNGVDDANIDSHIAYNLCMRPGRALIVDGILIYKGVGVSEEILNIHLVRVTVRSMDKDTAPYQ